MLYSEMNQIAEYISEAKHYPFQGLEVPQVLAIAKKFSDPIVYDYTERREESGKSDNFEEHSKGHIYIGDGHSEFSLRVGELPPTHIIYHYIESNIPVILVIPTCHGASHLMVAIGHDFNPDQWYSYARRAYFGDYELPFRSSFEWIQNFIIQDDNFGPYAAAPTPLFRYFAEEVNLVVIIPIPRGLRVISQQKMPNGLHILG